MLRRFVIIFGILIPLQFLAIRFGGGFRIIYIPFVDFVEPFVIRHYGRNDGSLGPLLLWGTLLGTFTYSVLLALAGALLLGRRPSTPEAHV